MTLSKKAVRKNVGFPWFDWYKLYVRRIILLPETNVLKDLSYWRNEIFYRILIYFTPLSIIALVPGVYMSFKEGAWVLGVVDIFSFLLLILLISVKNLSLQIRKVIFIGIFYLLSVVLLYYLGMMGPGLLFLLVLTILSSIIYSASAGYYSGFINAFICIGISLLNYWSISSQVVQEYSLGAWIAVSSNLVLLSFACAKCMDHLLGGLSISLYNHRISEEKIKKINRLYNFISKINQLIILVKNEEALFQNCCSTALEIGRFKMAWIGRFDILEKKVNLLTQSGIPENEQYRFSAAYRENGPQEYVLKSGRYLVCNNVEKNLELKGWGSFIELYGIKSFMILPIMKEGIVIGTYNLYATELDFFDKEEIQLLVEATQNISFALDIFEKEKKQRALEEEQIKTQKTMQLSENKFRQIVETAQEGIWLIDDEEKTVFVNSKMCEILGYQQEEILGKEPFHFMDEDGIEIARAAILRKREGIVGHSEFKYLSKTGKEVWTIVSANPQFNENGIYTGSLAMVMDMTEYRKAEENLVRSETRLKEAQELSHISNWEIDLVTNVSEWSNEFYCIFGLERNSVEPSPETFLSFIQSEDVDRVRKEIEMTFKNFTSSSIYSRINARDGRVKDIYSAWRFEYDKNQKPIRLYGILQDITNAKVAEKEKERMTVNIVQHSKKLEQFAFIVSHNLRAPVAQILGLSQVLKHNISEEDRAQSQQFLFIAAERLDVIIKDLNKILEVKSEVSEQKEPVFFYDLVHTIAGSISKLIEKENVKIETDFNSIGMVVSVKSYLYSIFYNLILNSIKYKQRDKIPFIKITSEITGKMVRISFKDNGIGIDLSKHRDKIFGLYQRFNLDGDGQGLGLYMIKTQIEALGGNIRVESRVNEGAEFIIELAL
jgi:PAS domain S-box-containing protein